MNNIPAIILSSLLLVMPLVTLAGAEEGSVSPAVMTTPAGFSVLKGVPAKALSDQEMDAIRGGAITFILTLSGSLPPSIPGVNLNLAVHANNLPQLEPAKGHCFHCSLCFNCVIIPG